MPQPLFPYHYDSLSYALWTLMEGLSYLGMILLQLNSY